MFCNILWYYVIFYIFGYSVIFYDILWYMIFCNAVWWSVICDIMRHYMIFHDIVWYSVICGILWYSEIMCYSIIFYDILWFFYVLWTSVLSCLATTLSQNLFCSNLFELLFYYAPGTENSILSVPFRCVRRSVCCPLEVSTTRLEEPATLPPEWTI